MHGGTRAWAKVGAVRTNKELVVSSSRTKPSRACCSSFPRPPQFATTVLVFSKVLLNTRVARSETLMRPGLKIAKPQCFSSPPLRASQPQPTLRVVPSGLRG